MNNDQQPETKGTILVVDDLLENLRLLNTILTKQGYKVRKVRNGKMALTTVQTNPPDLILLDINMPEMNGFEVCKYLKYHEQSHNIPVIFLSALDEQIDKVKAFAVGGVDYITKPFQVEEVLARVKNHLAINRLQQQLMEQNALLIESEAKEREKSRQLEENFKQFQKVHLQLIQSEKMSGLGQLVAGVAHEINNPVNFISGNLYPAKEYSQNLLHLLHLYQQFFPNPPAEIQALIEDIDLDFVKSDFLELMDSMLIGVERIQEIVASLRTFSRLNEAESKAVDIHKNLDSTLRILKHRLQAQDNFCEIKVVKEYDEFPKIDCYPGQLNQVFMNILSNAIDALEAQRNIENADPSNPPKITIRTKLVSEEQSWATILISDNGPGIAEDIQQRIFDPFFTTKEIGKGTGLGMSISYQIVVEKHLGKLRYFSTPEQGAMFVIEIPVNS